MPCILVADDDAAIRTTLRLHLEDCEHRVLEAPDGTEALRLAREREPDLMLLDLRMPGLDGMGVLRHLGRDLPKLPVIVISGVGQVAEAVGALKCGAWDFLTKPISDFGVLDHAIERALERKEMQRQLEQYQQELEEKVRQRTAELQEKTIALREVLRTVQAEKQELLQAIAAQVEHTVTPLLQRLRGVVTREAEGIVDHILDNLGQLTPAPADPLCRLGSGLSPVEMRICRLIRQEMSSKEIAQAEGISVDTVETHRRNIRRKLKITNEKVNLVTYLQSLSELDPQRRDGLDPGSNGAGRCAAPPISPQSSRKEGVDR